MAAAHESVSIGCAITTEAVKQSLMVGAILVALVCLVVIVHSIGVLKGRREQKELYRDR